MKEFTDSEGRGWTATVRSEDTTDYKGRYHLVFTSSDGEASLPLRDVRWNSERTARRTIDTMSEVELRRRLRVAKGRATPSPLSRA